MNKLIYTVQIMNGREKEEALTLELLQAIEQNKDVTQRHLADRLGVALGLANSYLKRCVRKGLVKITQAPANRYFYYLTPHGFTEKSRLTAEYLSHSFDFYRKASSSMNSIYHICEANAWKNIILCGVSELAEIASLRAQEHSVQILGIFEPDTTIKGCLDFQVWSDLSQCHSGSVDAFVLTALNDGQHIYELILAEEQADRILVPNILGISQ
jgi:DNA-binding MarR family transcriptional regulator